MDGHHKIFECWFSGLVVLIHSALRLTVVILPSKNMLGLQYLRDSFQVTWLQHLKIGCGYLYGPVQIMCWLFVRPHMNSVMDDNGYSYKSI